VRHLRRQWKHGPFLALAIADQQACRAPVLRSAFDLDAPYTGDFIVDWKRCTDAEQRMAASG
jgi:hypothetical protein